MNGAECLVVYPNNFEGSSSFIRLDDPFPHATSINILDNSTWKKCV
jgi:hypothetical protein